MLAGAHQVPRRRVAVAFVVGTSVFAGVVLLVKIVTGTC